MRGKPFGLALSLVVAGWLATAPSARAADPKAVADALVAAVTASGARSASYEGAIAEGDNVAIANVKIARTHSTVVIPKVVVVAPGPRDGGGFTASEIVFDGGTATSRGRTATWRTGSISEVVIPSAEEAKTRADLRPFATLGMSGITVTGKGMDKPGTIDTVSMSCGEVVAGSPRMCTTGVKGIVLNAAMLAGMPREKAMLDSLGYDELRMDVTVEAGYDRAAGVADLKSLVVDMPEGTLTLSAKLSDLPIDDAEGQSLRATVTRKARLDRFSMRFENRGFVQRALAAQAKATGVPVEEAPDQMNGMVMAALIALNNMDFAAKAAEATSTFLADPKTLSIEITPSEPITLRTILSKVFTDGAALVDTLGIDIKANQ
jgi:hypothetical protein